MPAKKRKTKKTDNSQQRKKKNNQTEQFKVYGSELVERVKELIKEGNVKKVIIKNEKGEILIEFPVNLAVVGGLLTPTLAAIGAFTALLTKCTIEIKKK